MAKRKKVNATMQLAAIDDDILRDSYVVQKIEKLARSNLVRPPSARGVILRPSLYPRFRGRGFPYTDHRHPARPWSKTTQWMKAQVSSWCLMSGPCKAFTIRLHDEVAEELVAKGVDLKVYVRDRLTRCLRDAYGCVPWFFFAIENRTASGLSHVAPHVHGMIQILPTEPTRLTSGDYSLKWKVKISKVGLDAARVLAGEELTRNAMKSAAGLEAGRPLIYAGRHQMRNVWSRKPFFPIFNPDWVSYCLKNGFTGSRLLPNNRFCMSRGLSQEAQRLWQLICEGEIALECWS